MSAASLPNQSTSSLPSPPGTATLDFNVDQFEWCGRYQQNHYTRSGSKRYCNFLSQEDADSLFRQVGAETVYANPALLTYRGVCPRGYSRSFQCDIVADSVSYCRTRDFNRTVWTDWTPAGRRLRDLVHQATGQRPNSMMLTLSRVHDRNDMLSRIHISGDLEQGSSMFIFSLGPAATVRLIPHQSAYERETVPLQHGTLLELSEATRDSYQCTMIKPTLGTRVDMVFCTLRSRFLPNEDVLILGASRIVYQWEDNIRHSLGVLRCQDPARLQAEDLMRLKAALSQAGGQSAALEHGILAPAPQETSKICALCGRDALSMTWVPYVDTFCYDCVDSWEEPEYKGQADAFEKALNDAREERLATHAHTVADAGRRVERVKVRLLMELASSMSTSSCIDSRVFLVRELQDALLHLRATWSARDNIKHDSPPWCTALSPAGFTPFPPFAALLTSSPLERLLEHVASHIAPWMLQNRDTIKALPRRRMLLWGEPLQIINQSFLDAGLRTPGGVECRVDDVVVEFRYEDDDIPPSDVLMFWDDCDADEVGGYWWWVVNEGGTTGVGGTRRTERAIEL